MNVDVTDRDIVAAKAGNCFRCAVALALARATGDDHANAYERDFELRLEAWGRSIAAPRKVRQFVRQLDDQPRDDSGRLDLVHPDCDPPSSFSFSLPEFDDPKWKDSCYACGWLFDRDELDDEGMCCKCSEKADR